MRLGLGTVQFGIDYGVSNSAGQVPPAEVGKILTLAEESGIDLLDTAFLYGSAEDVLGKMGAGNGRWKIVTKLPPVADRQADEAARYIHKSFRQSLEKLAAGHVYALLAHDADDLLSTNGESVWSAMTVLRRNGLTERIGASVYEGRQVDALLERYPLDIIQLPFSILDRRLESSGRLDRLSDAGVEIHVRSIFLQGIVLMQPSSLPPALSDIAPHLNAVHSALARAGLTPLQGALAAVNARPGLEAAIIGVTSRRELADILAAQDSLSGGIPDLPFEKFALSDPQILNPRHWPALNRTSADG